MHTPELLTGHPVSLTILDYGVFRVHAGPRDIGLMGALIRTDAGEQVLVDTGLPGKYAQDCDTATRADGLESFGQVLNCCPLNMPGPQLELAGSSLDQITLMVQTHTHIDHIGGIASCAQAPIVIGAAERAQERPLYWGKQRPVSWPDRTYVPLEKDTRIGPGFQVLSTPGHTPGQLALMIDLPNTGTVIWTSDAISRPGEMLEGFDGAWNPYKAHAQANRLMTIASQTNATVIYGHCPDQWKTLRKAPQSYS